MEASTVLDLWKATTLKTGKDTGHQIVGIRDGEKLHESLVSTDEVPYAYDCGTYFMIAYGKRNPVPVLKSAYTSDSVKILSPNEIVDIMAKTKLSF
jgi:FlaA1/EpsC-like NDP-sugar epimerase